jgi:hypothetical protein
MNNVRLKSVNKSTTSTRLRSDMTDDTSSINDKFFDALGYDNDSFGLDDENDDDDDDRSSSCFYDTATSRHQSEIESVINSPLCSPRNLDQTASPEAFLSDSCFHIPEEDKQNESEIINDSKIERICKNLVENIDIRIENDSERADEKEDEGPDAELETPWSFWIDR